MHVESDFDMPVSATEGVLGRAIGSAFPPSDYQRSLEQARLDRVSVKIDVVIYRASAKRHKKIALLSHSCPASSTSDSIFGIPSEPGGKYRVKSDMHAAISRKAMCVDGRG